MAGDLRISMLVDLNAQRARAEAAALRAETDALGKSARTAGASAGAAASGIAAVGAAGGKTAADFARASRGGDEFAAMVASIRSAINPLADALQQAQAAIRDVATAEELGALTAREAALAHDHLARSVDQIIAKMAQYASAEDASAAAALRVETAAQRLIAANTGIAASTGDSIAAQLQHGAALDEVRARFDPLFAASRRYELELREIAEAERAGAISATGAAGARERASQSLQPMAGNLRQIGGAAQNAGAHVTQLGYQANDIFVMMAAGQNPMALAMQQGTQVTQVFQGMKASGLALGPAIKGALLQMVSPMSLVTMGAIALAAYGVQALMSMGEQTKSLKDALGDLTTETRAWSDQSKSAVRALEDEFGKITPGIAAMRLQMLQLGEVKALQALHETMKAIKAEASGGWFASDVQATADLLGVQAQLGGARTLQNSPVAAKFQAELDALSAAKGPQQQLAILERINAQFIAATGGIGAMDAAQVQFYDGILATELATRRVVEAQKDAARAQLEVSRAAGLDNGRMGAPLAIDLTRKGITDTSAAEARRHADDMLGTGKRELEIAQALATFGDQSVQVRAIELRQAREALDVEIARMGLEQDSAQALQLRSQLLSRQAAQEAARKAAIASSSAQMIAQLQSEANIVRLTAKYGADSLEVTYARVAAERQAEVALLASQGITGTLADNQMRAWDAARGIAAVNMAAGIGAAAGEARLLAANLGISLAQAIALMGLAAKAPKAVAPRFSFGLGPAGDGFGNTPRTDLSFGPNPGTDSAATSGAVVVPRAGGGGGGGGGRAAETNSILTLIAAQERELAVLRETDPVKRELLQQSEQMANATTEQKTRLEGLIRTRLQEKDALEAIQRAQEELRETGRSAFVGLVSGTMTWRDALSQVAGKLADLTANSAFDLLWRPQGGGGGGLFGSLFSGLFGGGATGGGTGALGLPDPFADGGRIPGFGGPRQDNHLVAVSSGEYIINAAATANALPLIEAINAGVPMHRLMEFIGGNRLAAFADGGQIGGRASGAFAPASWARSSPAGRTQGGDRGERGPRVLEQHIHIHGATGNAEIREMVAEGIQAGIEAHDREVLPMRVGEVMRNQRVRGR